MTTRESAHRTRVSAGGRRFGVGAACRNRTDDLLITSETLYRLSYGGAVPDQSAGHAGRV